MSYAEMVMVVGCAVLLIGLVAHLLVPDLFRRIVSLNIASGGVMMVLLALADRGGAAGADESADPVPQALVLTGIVIMAAITGLALALARRVEGAGDENEAQDGPQEEGKRS